MNRRDLPARPISSPYLSGPILASPYRGAGNRVKPIGARGMDGMEVIAVSTDPVRLSFLGALLNDAGIAWVVLDQHISATEGGIGIFPRRLAVAAADAARARRVLAEAGEA